MAMLTIRNIDDNLKHQLRIRAAKNGLSTEEEVHRILQQAITLEIPQKKLGSRIHQTVMAISCGMDFELPQRSNSRPAPDFTGHAS